MIAGAKPLFEAGRLSYGVGYLKPAKKLLVDLTVSKTGLDKALAFANQLFLALEEHGHRVVIAPSSERLRRIEIDQHEVSRKIPSHDNRWSPGRCTVVYIGTVAIGLTVIEMSEEIEARYVNGEYVRLSDYIPPKHGRHTPEHGWTSKHDFPNGRLCLQAYSPYWRAEWRQQWRDTKTYNISSHIAAIVKGLEQAVSDVARIIEEGERQAEQERQRWEAQQAEWRRVEAERLAAKALKDSKEELLQIIEMWAESKRLEAFFADAEQRLVHLSDDERERTLDRLKRARELIGTVDALDRLRSWRTPDER